MADEGLRERKKRETREAIIEAARRLFHERGFAGVTVAQVASAADVSQQTVFNYFPTKEDLFFSGMRSFEADLVEAVRQRPSGEPALAAFRRALLAGSDRLADRKAAEAVAAAGRLIEATPALQSRERAVLAEHTRALAAVLTEDSGTADEDVEPLVVANALMGVHAALLGHVRALAARGVRSRDLVEAFEAEAARACGRLERGLRDYAVKRGRTKGGEDDR